MNILSTFKYLPCFAEFALLRDVRVHRIVRGAKFVQKNATLKINEILDGIIT